MDRHKIFVYLLLVALCTSIVTASGCRYGKRCIFPCRCKNDGVCDKDTGHCNEGCDQGRLGQGWRGLACQVGNIAEGKLTRQNNEVWGDDQSSRATDGYLATNASEYNCARIHNKDGGAAEWSVDLEYESKVESLLIYSTHDPDGASTVTNFSFVVHNETGPERVCHNYDGRAPFGDRATLSINCIPPALGRFVVIRRFGKKNPDFLTLCEVLITGYRYIDCSQCPGSCSDIRGCRLCPPGRRLPDCAQPCETGFYGTNCESRCEYCQLGTTCDPVDGHCPAGCRSGWMGQKCNMHQGSVGDNPGKQSTITGYPSYTKPSVWGTGPSDKISSKYSSINAYSTKYKSPTTTTSNAQDAGINSSDINSAANNNGKLTVFVYILIHILNFQKGLL